jgi:hypothetical protein
MNKPRDPLHIPTPQGGPSPDFERHVETEKLGRKPEHAAQNFTPSSIAGCPRSIYYDFLFPKDTRVFSNNDGAMGRAVEHMFVTEWLRRSKLLIEGSPQKKLERYGMSGRIDGLIRWRDVIMPVEVKSVDTPAKMPYPFPRPEAYIQAQCYAMLGDYPRVMLAYVPKVNPVEWRAWEAPRDETAIAWIRERMEYVQTYRDIETPPPRPVENPAQYFRCGRCDHFKPCWEGTAFAVPAAASEKAGVSA